MSPPILKTPDCAAEGVVLIGSGSRFLAMAAGPPCGFAKRCGRHRIRFDQEKREKRERVRVRRARKRMECEGARHG